MRNSLVRMVVFLNRGTSKYYDPSLGPSRGTDPAHIPLASEALAVKGPVIGSKASGL